MVLGKSNLNTRKMCKRKKLNNSIQAYKINILSEQEYFFGISLLPSHPLLLEYSICSSTQDKSYTNQGRELGRMKEDKREVTTKEKINIKKVQN